MTRIASADLFPTEDPLPAGEMFGRDNISTELIAALEGRTHCILAEPRRTGKTTLAKAVLAELEARDFYVTTVDLWEVADQAEFAAALVTATIANRPLLKRLPHALKERGKKAADAVQLVASTKLTEEFGQEVELAWKTSLAERDLRRYVRFALELPERIAKKDRKKMIVFFDEFQNVLDLELTGGTKDTKALQKLMRSVFQGSEACSYLFAGSIEHLIRKIFSAEEPLGHFGGFFDLEPIDVSEWRSGLRGRFELDGRTITSDALNLNIELGELHPRATMLIAQQAHVLAVLDDRPDIDTELIRLGHAQARRRERARHQSMVDRVRGLGGKKTGARALKTIKRLARGEEIYAQVEDKKAVTRAVEHLRDAGFIERPGDQWTIRDPLLRLYLADL